MTTPSIDSLKLGRIPAPPDDRDKNYPFMLALPQGVFATQRRWRYWAHGRNVLDQDGVGACVGFAGANWLQSSPVRTPANNQTGFDLYYACKAIDGYPGEGTWDRVLMKVLQQQGRIKRYLWAQTPAELDVWLLEMGPVLIGVPWYSDMFYTNEDGLIRGLGGGQVGGHEVLLRGVNLNTGIYTFTNSWTRHWGRNGDGRITKADLFQLLWVEWGTACTAEEQVAP